jgi:type I restriction enzyme S subunit
VIIGIPKTFGQFEILVAPLLERVRSNRAESRTLAETRDLLLPKLMSGEIRVRDAEKIVEDAA